jgi:acyl carrier protein
MTAASELYGARTAIVLALADVLGIEVADAEAAIAEAGGDLATHIDSKQAEVIIAFVEELFGCELPSPADLQKEQFTTVAALIELVLPAIVFPSVV